MCISKSADDNDDNTNYDVGCDGKFMLKWLCMSTLVLFHSQDDPKTHFKEDNV